MNLHEECLLKYLLNPTELFHSTEILEKNNDIIKKSLKQYSKKIKTNCIPLRGTI